jgi:hypothetical protein
MAALRPFWNYFGGKWRSARSYPAPQFGTVIEPFAGAAGYSLHHHQRAIVLVEKYHVVAEVWRFLTSAKPTEVLRIPIVEAVDDLPRWVCSGARWLVGFALNFATSAPRATLSSGLRKLRSRGHRLAGWTDERRALVAMQLEAVKHWRVIEGDYSQAPEMVATHFIDAPYQGRAGMNYVHGSPALNYDRLAAFATSRRGQTIVCEGLGAKWLPFSIHRPSKAGPARAVSHEVIWTGSHGVGQWN